MTNPKPCPFCGASIPKLAFNPGNTHRWWLAGCPECGVSMEVRKSTAYDVSEPTEDEKAGALLDWNIRPVEATLRAELAQEKAAREKAEARVEQLEDEMPHEAAYCLCRRCRPGRTDAENARFRAILARQKESK